MKFLEHDIEDPNFLRYVKRFLIAGIMEGGTLYDSDAGVPQGGLISPVLANVYLHYVIDMWFAKVVAVKSKGKAEMIRYADDVVFCFEQKEDATRFYEALKIRLAKFDLELSEEKSKIIRFGKDAGKDAEKFDFLGFTHVTATNAKGNYYVKRITSKKKLKAKKQKVKMWLRENMHTPIKELVDALNRKLRGHYNYYGITGNYKAMKNFREYVLERLKTALNRRGAKKDLTEGAFRKLMQAYPVIQPRIAHGV
jgi:group II intron reverse transcriptase/maturase